MTSTTTYLEERTVEGTGESKKAVVRKNTFSLEMVKGCLVLGAIN